MLVPLAKGMLLEMMLTLLLRLELLQFRREQTSNFNPVSLKVLQVSVRHHRAREWRQILSHLMQTVPGLLRSWLFLRKCARK
jgi:hypothetical protein